MPLWVFNLDFNVGKLYVKSREQIPVIDITSSDQVSRHLTASAEAVYRPKSHSRCRDGDRDGELFIFGRLW